MHVNILHKSPDKVEQYVIIAEIESLNQCEYFELLVLPLLNLL